MDGARAVLGSGEVPVLAGDGALKSAQTEVGHIPVFQRQLRGAGTRPPSPCPAHSCCPGETRGCCSWRCARGGARCWRRAGKDSLML